MREIPEVERRRMKGNKFPLNPRWKSGGSYRGLSANEYVENSMKAIEHAAEWSKKHEGDGEICVLLTRKGRPMQYMKKYQQELEKNRELKSTIDSYKISYDSITRERDSLLNKLDSKEELVHELKNRITWLSETIRLIILSPEKLKDIFAINKSKMGLLPQGEDHL